MGASLVPVGITPAPIQNAVRGLVRFVTRRGGTPATSQYAGTINGPRAFLASEHEIHATWMPWWLWLERAMKGGIYMQALLRRFDWEIENEDSINQRRRTATYINWPDLYATALTGHLMRSGPDPKYGALGDISATDTPLSRQTRADLFHFNVDGAGQQGSEWAPWWMTRGKSAMAYGHTWIMEEAPRRPPTSRLDERFGVRPYLVEWTPPRVWDWHFEDGALQYAIIRYQCREPRLSGSGYVSTNALRYYLLTRKGWDGWGPDYKGGGYWLYDDKGEPVGDSYGVVAGNFDSLDGEIPFHPLYFQRDCGTDDAPAMSRSGVAELSALAESFMNVSSAADFETWDSAKGMEYFLGVSVDAFNLAMNKITEGSRFIPVPGKETLVPQIHSSDMSSVPTSSFKERLDAKRVDAETYSSINQNASPDASGAAREADFANAKAPILSLFASEIQTAQNVAIYNIQRRWGVAAPAGGVIWPRKFELVKAQAAVADVFDAAVAIGAKSPTLMAEGVIRLCRELGLITDDTTLSKIRTEIEQGAALDRQASSRLADLRNKQGGGGADPGAPGGPKPPAPISNIN